MSLIEFLDVLNKCSKEDDLIDLCRKTILHGTPFVFNNRENEFYDFRKRIADKFEIIFHEIYITGSGKLGFSPIKKKQFDLDSDIDVAIVSNILFDRMMETIRIFQMDVRNERKVVTTKEMKMYHTFLEYTTLGWIRPDLLPISFQVKELKDDWFEFFNSISYNKSEVGDYKVSAGIYKSYFHLEEYTLSGLRQIQKSNNVG